MKFSRIVPTLFAIVSVYGASHAIDEFHTPQNPVKEFVDFESPIEFANRFKGDTIFFYISNSEDRYFESFYLLYPDTIWLKERPKKKLPEREKHYRLRTNYNGVSGWGVNSYRFYTPGSAIDNKMFIIKGSLEDRIEYLGKFQYVILEDVLSGELIKWDYSKKENSDIVIFSPSIIHRLNSLRNKKTVIEVDTTLITGVCKEVSYSIDVKGSRWIPKLDTSFETGNGVVNSTNWVPKYFIVKEK